MSISKQQADALADSFLDDIGADPDVFAPKESMSLLFRMAAELIVRAQQYLNNDKSNASGKLSESITTEEPVAGNGFIQQDVSMNFYGQFINKGVRGVKSGSGQYRFKTEFPGDNMVKAIGTYIKTARSKIGTEKKAPGKNESKNIEVAKRQSAYAMARSIKQHGIKATKFMDKAIDDIDKIIEAKFEEALTIDVINSLPDEL